MSKVAKFFTFFFLITIGTVLLTGIGGWSPFVKMAAQNKIVQISVSDYENGVTLLDESEESLTLRVDVGTIEFVPVSTPEGDFILPRIDGFSRSFKEGEPTLPVASKMISIPIGCKMKTEIIDSTTKEIVLSDYNLTAPFMPVQPSLSKSDNPMDVPFKYNKLIYASSSDYTLPLVDVEASGILRSTRLGRVSVSPIEYKPSQKKMLVHTSVTVRVYFNGANWEKTRKLRRKYKSPQFDAALSQVINYGTLSQEDDLVTYPVKYLIIADRMFESQLEPFIQWKTKKGFVVVTAYTDTIGTTTSAIKSYIEDLYDAGTTSDPAPSYVLFVGDVQQIPAWSGSAGSHITDLRYCEFTDDDYPEIYYGRFSAQSTTQLQPQIDKTLEYEQYTMPDPSYLAYVTLVSGVDSSYAATYGNGQINYGTTNYFNASHGITPSVWLYPASDGSTAAADIIDTISDGVGFYNYTAHCSHNGPADPVFSQSDISSLTNSHQYLLGIGNCCLSNTFGSDYSTPCFGEAWLQAENKGGIGWIGGSNSTYWDEDYWWGVGSGDIVAAGPDYEDTGIGAYDGIFHDNGEAVTQHYTSNGAIIFAGNMAVTEAGSSRIQYYWEIYHLMGDPSVMTYMGVPSTNTVSHPSSVTTTATSITVQADSGSYVGISRENVWYGAGYIGDTGSATISINAFGTTGTADIVVTCQNKQPYISTITVGSSTEPPTAEFSASPVSGVAPLTVTFTDQSTGATSWSWDFGDSTTSTAQNPSHTYTSVGTYTVSLTATNTYGSDTETKTSYITATTLQSPVVDFSASATSIDTGDSVTFTDASANSPTSWSWTFNGGTPSTSTDQNPSVIYSTAGTYSVTLVATNAAGSDTETKTGYITVTDNISYCTSQGNNYSYEWIEEVEIDSFSNTSGAAGYTDFTSYTVSLTGGDTVSVSLTPGFASSTYSEYWKIFIDYNRDGDFTDSGEEVFSGNGTSTVTGSFTVSNSVDCTTRMRVIMKYNSTPTSCETFSYGEVEDYTVTITAGTIVVPVAEFSASDTSITTGSSVTFTDQSTNNPTSWSWSFTGGTPSTSTSQNPTVTYNTAGTYAVSLTATNSAGSDTETKTGYITVTEEEITYCTASGNDYSYEWIADVNIGGIDNSSGAAGYTDFTSVSTNLTRGNSVSVALTPGFAGTTYTEYWKVWIDYNQDGDFEDSGEEVFSSSGTSAVSGTFTVSSSATTGSTRMRVIMKYSSAPSYCGTFTYGEVEDYTVNIQ